MRVSSAFLALAMAATSVMGVAVKHEEKRYAILDNDWSSTGESIAIAENYCCGNAN